MGAWLESYRKLSPEQQDRVQSWLHLNKFISKTLRIDWEEWVGTYLERAMAEPLDFSFMEACLPGFSGLDVEGAGVTFSRDVDPATTQTARVPLRAKNNLGRLSAALQDALVAILDGSADGPTTVVPSDVAALQKILSGEKALAKLKRKDFRSVVIARDDDEVVIRLTGGTELVRSSVIALGAEMRKAWV